MKNTFENYLQEVHAMGYHGTDDDMSDNFEAWLGQLDVAEVMKYAEQCVRELQAKIERAYEIAEKMEKLNGEAIAELEKIRLMISHA
jgi:hypothetical protein